MIKQLSDGNILLHNALHIKYLNNNLLIFNFIF